MVTVLSTVLAVGCASWPDREDPRAKRERAIATDFAQAIRQLDEIAGDDAPIGTRGGTPQEVRFAEVLGLALARAGLVTADPRRDRDARLLEIRIEPARSEASAAGVYVLSLDGIGLKREYDVADDDRFVPVGSLFVRGTDATGIRLDTAMFERLNATDEEHDVASVDRAEPADTIDVPPPRPEPASERDALAQRSADASPAAERPVKPSADEASRSAVNEPVSDTRSLVAPLVTASSRDEPDRRSTASDAGETIEGAPAVTDNYFELGGSNFSGLFGNYVNVAERILVFGNDSMRLGEDNKRQIEALVADFDASRDLFSIVGCSLGPTSIPNGNEVLATGRANRVAEALMFAGVPRDRILDEGCWAGEASLKMPSRGVVLTHKRESD